MKTILIIVAINIAIGCGAFILGHREGYNFRVFKEKKEKLK